MTSCKRILSVVLCLCLLCAAMPTLSQAAPAGVFPEVVVNESQVHKETLAKKDIASTVYAPGATSADSKAKTTVTNLTNGQRLLFQTSSNKLSELYIVPFSTSLKVPAYTTCTVEQTFTFKGAKQYASSNKATAAASFELLDFNETAVSGTTVVPRTSNSKNYGANKGTALFRGSRLGTSSSVNGDLNLERNITLESSSTTQTLTLVYENNTGSEKTVSKNFGFWGCTQYGSKYENNFAVAFSVTYQVTSTERVTFNANGGTVSPAAQTVTYGAAYKTLPTPTRGNYTFNGWFTAATGGTRVLSTTEVTTFGAHTLYAHWTGKKFTVTFNANGGTVTTTGKTVTYGEAYGDLPTPTRENYSFDGWYTAATGGTKVTETTTVSKTADHTLYARWKANQYTVTLDTNGGTLATKSITVTYGETYGDLPVPTREGCGFGGWYTEDYGEGTEVTSTTKVTATGSHTLHAYWVDEANVVQWWGDAEIEYGQKSLAGFGLLSVDNNYDYLFEWYQCDDKNKTNTRKIAERTGDESLYKTPTDLPVGKYYYYIKMTTIEKKHGKSTTITGPVQEITVVPSTPKMVDWPSVTIDLKTESPRLGDHKITGGSAKNEHSEAPVTGTFTWVEPDTTFTGEDASPWEEDFLSIKACFTPDDSKNYKPTEVNLRVWVTCSHEFVDDQVMEPATCTEKGKMRKVCKICNAFQYAEIPAAGHDYENGAWQTNQTQHWKQCAKCSSTNTPADHIFGNWSGGIRTCEACGYSEEQVITVTIIWGEMAFTYQDGSWDPETHNYALGEWTANSAGGNEITVENQGEGEVAVSFSYTPADDAVNGHFADESGNAVESPAALLPESKKYARLYLSGQPKKILENEPVGTVTVRLGGNE